MQPPPDTSEETRRIRSASDRVLALTERYPPLEAEIEQAEPLFISRVRVCRVSKKLRRSGAREELQSARTILTAGSFREAAGDSQ